MSHSKASFDVEMIPSFALDPVGRENHMNWAMYEDQLNGIGTKDNPMLVNMNATSFYVHPDSIALEMAPARPLRSPTEFLEAVESARQYAALLMGYQMVGVDAYDLRTCAYINTPKGQRTCANLLKRGRTMGCAPDYQYGAVREVPAGIKESPVKETSFHLHIDVPEHLMRGTCIPQEIIGPSLQDVVDELRDELSLFTPRWEFDLPPWYRQPGVFRPKPYGLEYRSLGGSLFSDPTRLANVAGTIFEFMAALNRRVA